MKMVQVVMVVLLAIRFDGAHITCILGLHGTFISRQTYSVSFEWLEGS